MDALEEILLETLSFYYPLTSTQILLQMDKKKIEKLPHITMEDLEKKLKVLKKTHRIKEHPLKGEKAWQRLFPAKKTWWQRLGQKIKRVTLTL